MQNKIDYTVADKLNFLTQLQHHTRIVTSPAVTAFPAVRKEVSAFKVSAVLITYNEERIIKETLTNLWWCDEVVIIDSGSTDRTRDICTEYGCSVYIRAFNGFGEQKRYGVSKAKNDWVLCIDADEILTPPLIEELRLELNKPQIDYAGFAVPRNLVFMNRVFKYGSETAAPIIRLFNRQRGGWDDAVVHEKIELNGPIKRLKNKMLHYSYQDYHQFIEKMNLYSGLGAQKLFNNKSSKSKLIVVLGIPFNFFKHYIINRNFLNGYHGFAWAVLSSLSHFVKHLKLDELKKQ